MTTSTRKPKADLTGSRRMPWKVAVVVLAVLAVAGAAVYVRGNDKAPSAAAVQETQRYCELSGRFDAVLVGAGISTEGALPPDVRPEAVSRVFTQLGPQAEELEAVAPSKIRGDVKTVLEALRRTGAGDTSATTSSGFTEARRRIAAYRLQLVKDPKSGCQSGAGFGDG